MLLSLVMFSGFVVVSRLVVMVGCGGVATSRLMMMLGRGMFALVGHNRSPGWHLGGALLSCWKATWSAPACSLLSARIVPLPWIRGTNRTKQPIEGKGALPHGLDWGPKGPSSRDVATFERSIEALRTKTLRHDLLADRDTSKLRAIIDKKKRAGKDVIRVTYESGDADSEEEVDVDLLDTIRRSLRHATHEHVSGPNRASRREIVLATRRKSPDEIRQSKVLRLAVESEFCFVI